MAATGENTNDIVVANLWINIPSGEAIPNVIATEFGEHLTEHLRSEVGRSDGFTEKHVIEFVDAQMKITPDGQWARCNIYLSLTKTCIRDQYKLKEHMKKHFTFRGERLEHVYESDSPKRSSGTMGQWRGYEYVERATGLDNREAQLKQERKEFEQYMREEKEKLDREREEVANNKQKALAAIDAKEKKSKELIDNMSYKAKIEQDQRERDFEQTEAQAKVTWEERQLDLDKKQDALETLADVLACRENRLDLWSKNLNEERSSIAAQKRALRTSWASIHEFNNNDKDEKLEYLSQPPNNNINFGPPSATNTDFKFGVIHTTSTSTVTPFIPQPSTTSTTRTTSTPAANQIIDSTMPTLNESYFKVEMTESTDSIDVIDDLEETNEDYKTAATKLENTHLQNETNQPIDSSDKSQTSSNNSGGEQLTPNGLHDFLYNDSAHHTQ
jgi:hypothetical protein